MSDITKDKATEAWSKLEAYLYETNVSRKEIQSHGRISNRFFDNVRTAKLLERSQKLWLGGLYRIFKVVNSLIENPPVGSRVVRDVPRSWEKLFGTDFPLAPDIGSTEPERGAMDSGAAAVGISWHRRSVVPYEELLRIELARFKHNGDLSNQRQVLEKLVSLYEATANWAGAATYLRTLRSINREFCDYTFVADCCLRLGIAHYRMGQWLEAKQEISEGLDTVTKNKKTLSNSKTELRLRSYQSLVELRMNNPRKALEIIKESVWPLVDKHGSKYIKATFFHRRAIIHMALNQFRESHSDFEEALRLRIECQAHLEVSRTLYYLGELCSRQKHTKDAVLIWLVCIQRHCAYEDGLGSARAYFSLATGYADLLNKSPHAQRFDLDLLGGVLSEKGLQLVAILARGYHSNASDGLKTVIPREELLRGAEDVYEKAIYWAEVTENPAIRNQAVIGLHKLRASRVKMEGKAAKS